MIHPVEKKILQNNECRLKVALFCGGSTITQKIVFSCVLPVTG